ncbi:MAG: PhnD/SsuA/transferrin family substrate-binding protein [Nitratireductor sp.]|nr:PhnD/SsuA/transferrin family substrate-binding protein [Nitratireductor sp.]
MQDSESGPPGLSCDSHHLEKAGILHYSRTILTDLVCAGLFHGSVAFADEWRTELGAFRVGIVGGSDLRGAAARAEPFRLALEEGLAMPVEIFATRDYPSLIDAATRSRIEYAVLSPLAFAATRKSCDCFEPLVAASSGDGTDSYRMVVIASATGPQNPQGLNGAAVGALRVGGAGGLDLALLELAGNGLDLRQTPNRLVLFDQGSQLLSALQNGEVAAIIGWSTLAGDPTEGYSRGTLQQLAATGGEISDYRVIWKSAPIPYRVHAVRSNLDAEAKTVLRSLLPAMFEADPVAYDSIEPVYGGGFVAARPGQFTVLEKLLPQDVETAPVAQ